MTSTKHRSQRYQLSEARQAEVERLLAAMTRREKIGQMTQVEYGSITPDQVAEWAIGSVLSGGGGNHGDGSASAWRDGVSAFVAGSHRSRLGVPILYGTDAVHGHSNVLGATIFPHNIGLGATRDPDLVRAIGRASALETAATGARWSFAPCLAVPQDPRWGRTYEGFSEDPRVVTALGRAAIEGWQGDQLERAGVLACAKHYVGEGAMVWGSAGSHRHPWIDWWDGWGAEWQIDQGDIAIDEYTLRSRHLPPFIAAIDAGVATVMACYASWQGQRIHAHRYLLSDVLKDELGFAGFVVSDWMGLEQVDADYTTAVERVINAGVDMVMVPFDFRRFIATVDDLVDQGRLTQLRIDDATRRILTTKARLGLLDPRNDVEAATSVDVVGCAEHRALARRAAAASAVVLTNNGVLPLVSETAVLAAGQALDDVGISCGGWTIEWAGGQGPITEGRTILDGLRAVLGANAVTYSRGATEQTERRAVGIVAVHELPYVEGGGDRADLRLPEDQVALVRHVRRHVDRLVVLVVSGRPLVLDAIAGDADAIVACWLPGSQADGIVDALFGAVADPGQLPIRWKHESTTWSVGHNVPVATHTAEVC